MPDGKGSKPVQVSLETEDWTGAKASAHVATLFPNQCGGTQALLSLVFSPGETVIFVARGAAPPLGVRYYGALPDEDGQFYNDDDDDDGDDDDMDDEYREIMQDMDYARQYLDDDGDDDDDDAFDDGKSLEARFASSPSTSTPTPKTAAPSAAATPTRTRTRKPKRPRRLRRRRRRTRRRKTKSVRHITSVPVSRARRVPYARFGTSRQSTGGAPSSCSM